MDRRSFLSWVGVSWLASSLPVAIASCFAETESAAAAPKLNLTCTHQGCAVKWQAAQNSYVFQRSGLLEVADLTVPGMLCTGVNKYFF